MDGGLQNNSRSTTLYALWSYCNSVWIHHFKVSGPSTYALTLLSWLLFKAYSIEAQYYRLLNVTETQCIFTLCSYVQSIVAMKTLRMHGVQAVRQ